jgi:hypothetical protein
MAANVTFFESAMEVNKGIAQTAADNLKLASTVILAVEDVVLLPKPWPPTGVNTEEADVQYVLRNTSGIPAEVSHVICRGRVGRDTTWVSNRPINEIFAPNVGHPFREIVPLSKITVDEWGDYQDDELRVRLKIIAVVTNPLGEERAQTFNRCVIGGRNRTKASFLVGNADDDPRDEPHESKPGE